MSGADGDQVVFKTPVQSDPCFEMVRSEPKFKMIFTDERKAILKFNASEKFMQNENFGEKPMSEEEIDETLDESFPASDPPSWSLGTNHGRENTEAKIETEKSEKTDRETTQESSKKFQALG